MGQRLVINVNKDGETICNCYYHWSAYTDCASALVQQFIPAYDEAIEKMKGAGEDVDEVLAAIRAFETTGATIYEDSRELFKERYPGVKYVDKECDRNDGLIDFNEDGMDESKGCGEAFVDINIDSRIVFFNVFFEEDEWDEEDEDNESSSEAVEIAKDFPVGIDEIPFDKYEEFHKRLTDADYSFLWHGYLYNKIA